MYEQIYEIIKNAVHGAEAVLTPSQEFILEQMASYMAYGVLLIPIIACIGITIKLLK